ncbi:MAG: O-antigen ligase family protein [Planctomycetes bacterium]|nr:O-antigen ligase family protein [Planctomycetota bacterium]
MLPVAPFILNVILLCNSRGAFLSCFATCGVLLFFAPRRTRKQVVLLLGLGTIALFVMLRDPRIIDRFMTVFVPSEEMDAVSGSRISYWKAGLRMIGDYPLGAGGNGFKRVHGPKYIVEVNNQVFSARAVHNGYINEACEWGIQGFILRMVFVGAGLVLLWQASRRPLVTDAREELFARLMAICLLAGMVGFLGTCMFGDRLDNEWGYWMVGLAVAHARLYAAPAREPEESLREPSSYAGILGHSGPSVPRSA